MTEVVWRPLRYEHSLTAQEIRKRVLAGETDTKELVDYAVSLVHSWGYLDVETGEPVPLDQVLKLSMEQVNELADLFNAHMWGEGTGVKKASPEASYSTRTKSNRARKSGNHQIHPTG